MQIRTITLALVLVVTGGATAATYQVGPTQPYADLGALPTLQPGDLVEVDGDHTYPDHSFWDSGVKCMLSHCPLLPCGSLTGVSPQISTPSAR